MTIRSQVGREQAGRRPALVLSPRVYNERVGLAIVCPITSRVKGYPSEVLIPGNPDLRGVVLADQVRSLNWRGRNAELILRLPAGVVTEVLQKIRYVDWVLIKVYW